MDAFDDFYYNHLLTEGMHIQYCENRLKWEMKNGDNVLIQNMTDMHIINCINLLEHKSNSEVAKAWIDIFNNELIKRKNKQKYLNNQK